MNWSIKLLCAVASIACFTVVVSDEIGDQNVKWNPLIELTKIRGGACYSDLVPVPCAAFQPIACDTIECEDVDEGEGEDWQCKDTVGTISVQQTHTGCSFGEPVGGSSCPPEEKNGCKKVRTCQGCFPNNQMVEICKKLNEIDLFPYTDYWPSGQCPGGG